jgi:hypothetical protein
MAGFLVTIVKLAHHVTKQLVYLFLSERHQSCQYSLDALDVRWLERTDNYAAVRGFQYNARSPDFQSASSRSLGDWIRHRSVGKCARAYRLIRFHVGLAPDLDVKRAVGSVTRRTS